MRCCFSEQSLHALLMPGLVPPARPKPLRRGEDPDIDVPVSSSRERGKNFRHLPTRTTLDRKPRLTDHGLLSQRGASKRLSRKGTSGCGNFEYVIRSWRQ